mmetsp:Transcript_4782/g.7296  ORF Transcript_4782/g.7296 Transcript_4782/m.7296 type:complete len:307 (-) Transcript_4782:4353-5273(-)
MLLAGKLTSVPFVVLVLTSPSKRDVRRAPEALMPSNDGGVGRWAIFSLAWRSLTCSMSCLLLADVMFTKERADLRDNCVAICSPLSSSRSLRTSSISLRYASLSPRTLPSSARIASVVEDGPPSRSPAAAAAAAAPGDGVGLGEKFSLPLSSISERIAIARSRRSTNSAPPPSSSPAPAPPPLPAESPPDFECPPTTSLATGLGRELRSRGLRFDSRRGIIGCMAARLRLTDCISCSSLASTSSMRCFTLRAAAGAGVELMGCWARSVNADAVRDDGFKRLAGWAEVERLGPGRRSGRLVRTPVSL